MNENTMIPSTFIVKGAKTLNIVSWAIDMVSGAWAFLPWPWRSEKEPQSCANPTVARAMEGHSEPVGRFLPAHLLDSLDDGAEVVAAAHGRESTKNERHREARENLSPARRPPASLGRRAPFLHRLRFHTPFSGSLNARVWMKIVRATYVQGGEAAVGLRIDLLRQWLGTWPELSLAA